MEIRTSRLSSHRLATMVSIAFFGFIIWVIYAANKGSDTIFLEIVRVIPFGDKVGHVILFGLLTFGAIASTQWRTFEVRNLSFYYGAFAVCLFVIVEELSQKYIPSRSFSVGDLAADLVGIVTAAAIARAVNPEENQLGNP